VEYYFFTLFFVFVVIWCPEWLPGREEFPSYEEDCSVFFPSSRLPVVARFAGSEKPTKFHTTSFFLNTPGGTMCQVF